MCWEWCGVDESAISCPDRRNVTFIRHLLDFQALATTQKCDNSWFYLIQSLGWVWGDLEQMLVSMIGNRIDIPSPLNSWVEGVENAFIFPGSLVDYTLMCDITQPSHYYYFINPLSLLRLCGRKESEARYVQIRFHLCDSLNFPLIYQDVKEFLKKFGYVEA